eukprot:1670829-Pyramimonas_sp.AAC.1
MAEKDVPGSVLRCLAETRAAPGSLVLLRPSLHARPPMIPHLPMVVGSSPITLSAAKVLGIMKNNTVPTCTGHTSALSTSCKMASC